MITRLLQSWRKPEGLDHNERSRHHDMLLALRHLSKHPGEAIWIPYGTEQLVDELKFLVEACGGNGNVVVEDRSEAGPGAPAGRTWKLKRPELSHVERDRQRARKFAAIDRGHDGGTHAGDIDGEIR